MKDYITEILEKIKTHTGLDKLAVIILSGISLLSFFNIKQWYDFAITVIFLFLYFGVRYISKGIRARKYINSISIIVIVLAGISTYKYGSAFYLIYNQSYEEIRVSRNFEESLAKSLYNYSQENFKEALKELPVSENTLFWRMLINRQLLNSTNIKEAYNTYNSSDLPDIKETERYLILYLSSLLNEKKLDKLLEECEALEKIDIITEYVKTLKLYALFISKDYDHLEQSIKDERINPGNNLMIRETQAILWFEIYLHYKDVKPELATLALAECYKNSPDTSNRSTLTLYNDISNMDIWKYTFNEEVQKFVSTNIKLLYKNNDYKKYWEDILNYAYSIGCYEAIEFDDDFKNSFTLTEWKDLKDVITANANSIGFRTIKSNSSIISILPVVDETSNDIQGLKIARISSSGVKIIYETQPIFLPHNFEIYSIEDNILVKYLETTYDQLKCIYITEETSNVQLLEFDDESLTYHATGFKLENLSDSFTITWNGEVLNWNEANVNRKVDANMILKYSIAGKLINSKAEYVNSAIKYFIEDGKLQLQLADFNNNNLITNSLFIDLMKNREVQYQRTILDDTFTNFINFAQPEYSASILYFTNGEFSFDNTSNNRYFLLLYKNDANEKRIINIFEIDSYSTQSWDLKNPLIE